MRASVTTTGCHEGTLAGWTAGGPGAGRRDSKVHLRHIVRPGVALPDSSGCWGKINGSQWPAPPLLTSQATQGWGSCFISRSRDTGPEAWVFLFLTIFKN